MMTIQEKFEQAKLEIGAEQFNRHYSAVFGKPCLNFVKTIVINLPGPCYANCPYCIDNDIRKHVIDTKGFLSICEKVFNEFSDIQEVSITGGSLNAENFNILVEMIVNNYPNATITWNTNGIKIDRQYNVNPIKYINLHRNSVDDRKNKEKFCTKQDPISIEKAKELFDEKLCLRVTIDEEFDLDEYAALGIPLYLNQMLPGTNETNEKYKEVLNKLQLCSNDLRRRNVYLNTIYNDIKVRVCVGDRLATHVHGRYPIYLNVVVVHRSGIVCGSWYEDDKVFYVPTT